MGNKKHKSIDVVLKKPQVSLEEVLDVESVLVKARTGDPALLTYLSSPAILHKMLTKIIEPYDTLEKSLKYPFVCCELLIIQVELLVEALSLDLTFLEQVWTFLQTHEKIDPQILVYITRVLTACLSRSPKIVLGVLKDKGGVLDLFLKHLDNTPAADFLCRLLEMESSTLKVLSLFDEEHFFHHLMSTIGPEFSEVRHFALYQFMNGLFMRSFPENYPLSSLVHRFTEPELFTSFMDVIIQNISTLDIYYQGINVISVICAKIHALMEAGVQCGKIVAEVASVLAPRLALFAAELDGPTEFYHGPTGHVPKVGVRRIKATRMFADLALLRSPVIVAEMRRLEIAEKLFVLFFTHPQNNFLHNNVVDFFAYLCQVDWPTHKDIIVENILKGSKLFNRITQAQRIADCLAEMPRKPRPNFMGHITILADLIHGLLEKHGAELYKEVGDLLRRENWIEYSNKSYRETKLKDAFLLGGEQPPLQNAPSEEVYTSVFSSGADETIIRYFCHEVISNFPPNLHLVDLDGDFYPEEHEDVGMMEDGHDEGYGDDDDPHGSILGSTLLMGNRGGFENIMELEMELRMSTIDDEDFDLGPDSEDDNIYAYS